MYPTEVQLTTMFDYAVSETRNLMSHVWQCIDALDIGLRYALMSVPDEEDEWTALRREQRQHISKSAKFLRKQGVALVTDGTEVRIGRPEAEVQEKRYSAKKKQHAINFLVVVTLAGLLFWVSTAYDSVPNDQGQWKQSGFRECMRGVVVLSFFLSVFFFSFLTLLTHFLCTDLENRKIGILGDGGFSSDPKYEQTRIRGFTPVKKKAKQKALTPTQRLYNLMVRFLLFFVLCFFFHIYAHPRTGIAASCSG